MDWMRTLKPDAIISDPFKVERFGVFCDLLVNHSIIWIFWMLIDHCGDVDWFIISI